MKTRFKTLLSLFCGTMLSLTLLAAGETASPPGDNCSYWFACEAIQKSYFEFSEGTDISQIDFGDLMYGKTQVMHEQIQKCYNPGSGLTVTRTLLNPEDALNPWMTGVHQSVLTRQGVQMFDDDMNELGYYPSSPRQLEFWQDMEDEISQSGFETPVSFDLPTAEEFSAMQAEGIQFFEYPDGRFSYSDGSTEVIVDPENLQIETNESVEGELQFTTIEGFIEGEEGSYFTSFKIEKAYQTLPSGVCGAFVTITNYSNVSTGRESAARMSHTNGKFNTIKMEAQKSGSEIGTIEVFPNPARNRVSIYLSNLESSDGIFSIKLCDPKGKTVLEESISNQNFINLSLPDLPKGLYILNVSSDKQSIVKKLMKN
jgi:hypothetical protein